MIALWNEIEKGVFSVRSTNELFNPYSTRNIDLDIDNAPALRRDNLRQYVSDHESDVSILLVAEAPGPWGCRFSGVPITSEHQLLDPNFPLQGVQTSTGDEPHTEYSAKIYWRVLLPYYSQIFTWNTVPLHPHKDGKPLSIRTPRKSEVDRFLPVLQAVVAYFDAPKILAVGRKAQDALKRIGANAEYVRHPSQGGAILFEEGVLNAISELNLDPDS